MRNRQLAMSNRPVTQQGRCTVCGGLYALKLNGTLYPHRTWTYRGASVQDRFIEVVCSGSREEPAR